MSFTQVIPTSVQTVTSSNFLSSGLLADYDMKKPQNDRKLVPAFGSQNISGAQGLMESLSGGKNPISGISFRHWEEQRLGVIINATGTAAGVGVAVLYTITSTLLTSFPTTFDPYLDPSATTHAPNPTGTATLAPVRLYQTVRFSDGTQGTVTAVNSATTFTVAPDGGVQLPTQTGAEPIQLGSVGNGEGGDMPKSMASTLSMVTGVMQIINNTASATGTVLGEEVWVKFDNGAGQTGWCYFLKNQWDAYRFICNNREVDMWAGEEITNTGDIQTFDATMQKTQGLSKWSETYSGASNYNITAGVSLATFDSLIIDKIDANKGGDDNSLWCSIRLSQSVDNFITPAMQAGAVSYGAFGGGKDQYVKFGFSGFERLGISFQKKVYGLLNDRTSLGAIPKWQNMGLVIPLSNTISLFGDKKEKIETPSLRMNYVAMEGYSREMQEYVISGATAPFNTVNDTKNIHYRSHFGLEVFRINAYNKLQGS